MHVPTCTNPLSLAAKRPAMLGLAQKQLIQIETPGCECVRRARHVQPPHEIRDLVDNPSRLLRFRFKPLHSLSQGKGVLTQALHVAELKSH
jgi:hypothetical protein